MNIKDAYIHNGEAILKDIQISGSKLQKLKAGKNADDTYLTWVDVLDLSPFGASGHNHDDRYLKLSGGTLDGGITFKYGSNRTDQFIQFSSTDSNDPQTVYLGIRRPVSSYGLCYKDNNGNLYDLIHSGNYTTYTVKKDGTGATGTWDINISGGLTIPQISSEADIKNNYLKAYSGSGSSWTGEISSMTYAAILGIGSPSRGFQLWAQRGDGAEASLHYRVGTSDQTAWNTERILIDNETYNLYSPKLDGTGATGTWKINISGNATTATKANSIATERGTNNAYRNVFFAYAGDNTKVVYDDDFTYNPSTNTLKIGTGTLTATNYSGTATNANNLANIAAGNYFKHGDAVFNSEWSGKYLWTLWDNHLYAADKRFAVTLTGTGETNLSYLFDGSFESGVSITETKAVLHIKHTTAGNVWTSGLPYGSFYVVFYNSDAENVTGRVYCKYEQQGIGWHDLTVTHVRPHVWELDNGYYQLSDLEITITKPVSSASIQLCQVLHMLERSYGPSGAAVMSKYCNQKTNYNIEAAKFIKTGGTSSQFLKADGSIDSNTYSKSNHTHSSVLDVGSSSAITFAYSKAGLSYGEYTYLAGWYGSELRAINKSQFAQASHTHTKSQITDFPTSLPANGGYADAIASKGMLDSQEKIDNFITPNRFEYALFKTTDANNVDFASNDGMIISIPWASDSYGFQMAFDDTRNGTIKVRGKSNSWGDWYTLLHSGNYTSYAVKKDGTGASGTWGISITGNAATATKLKNSRTIWGQSFDGTGKVSGSLTEVTDITASGNVSCSNLILPLGGKIHNGENYGLYISGSAGDYGSAIYLTHDHGKNQTAFRIHSHYDSNLGGLTIGFSTTTQNYGASPINATYDDILHIRGNGNIGIGTTSPSYKLHVVGDIYTTTGFKKKDSSDSYVLLGGGGHKLLSDLSMAHDHPYLPLSGGTMSNTNKVTNLNADLLDGYHASYFHIKTARSYNSVDALPTDSDGWYNIFTLSDSVDGAVICTIKAYAHSSLTFIASKGYAATATLQILQYNGSGNDEYFYIKGVRIAEGGKIQALFHKTSSTSKNISVSINIFSSHGTLRPNETLTLETGNPTIIAGPLNGTHGKITSDIIGNLTGNASTATSATTSTYASNVGSSGTAGTNYVTAANVISMYNWYNSITATDEASNTAIDKWNEIVSFLTGITDTSTLSGLLANYLPLTGGTLSGNLQINHNEVDNQYIIYKNNRIKENGGGWADNIIIVKNSSNANVFNFGVYGGNNSLHYTYLGTNSYDGNNLRIYSDKVCFGANTIYHSGNLPAYPTVNNGALYLQANGTTKVTFTANQSDNSTLNIATGSSNGTISVGGTNVSVKGLGSNAYTSTAYLPLAGGTMDDNAQIKRARKSSSWIRGRDSAIIAETSSSGYHPLFSLKTKDGSWELGEYNASGLYNVPIFSYITDADYSNNNNTYTYQIRYPLASGTIALTADLTWSNISSKPETATRWPSWSEVTNKPSTFPVSEHNHDGRYLRWNGSAADISAMAWGTLTAANGYTILSHAASSDGGDWGMVNKSGKIYMQLDGYYYQNEGQYRVTDVSETVTALGTSGDYLTWTKNGTTNNITVPYASNADTVDDYHISDNYNLLYKNVTNLTCTPSSITTDYWYVKILIQSSYQNITNQKMYLIASYSNFMTKAELQVYGYFLGYKYTASSYNADTITGIASTRQGASQVIWLRMKKPTQYEGVTPNGNISIYSNYIASAEVITSAPSDVIFTDTLQSDGQHILSGDIKATSFKKNGSSDNYVLLGGGGHKAISEFKIGDYLPLAGGWMDWKAQIYFKGINGSTSIYSKIGYDTSASGNKMHCINNAGHQVDGALYITSNGSTAANDTGGLAIDNEGVTVFGAGDPGSNFTGIFRVLNEDNVADGPQFLVTKASGSYSKYGFIKNGYNNDYVLLAGGGTKAISDFAVTSTLSNYVLKKPDTRFYNYIGCSYHSNWYKVTFPFHNTTSTNNRWMMVSMELILKGNYLNGADGTVYLSYYIYYPANNNVGIADKVYAVAIGSNMNNVRIAYNKADLGIFYVYVPNNYNSFAIQNLSANDTAQQYDFTTTTIDALASSAYPADSEIQDINIRKLYTTDGTSLMLNGNVLIDAGNIGSQSVSYANSAGNARNLLGRTTTGSDYGAVDGNLVFAEWNTYGDNRWYLKAKGFETRVGYTNDSDKLDGYHETSFYRHRGNYGKSYTAASTEYNLDTGTYTTEEKGYSGTLLSFNSSGSASAIQFWTHYMQGNLYYRTSVDSRTWSKTDGSWTRILDSDSYTEYTVKKDGTGATGTWRINVTGSAGSVERATFGDRSNGTHDANAMTSNGLYYYSSNGPTINAHNFATNDAAMYVQAYNSSWVSQIAQDYRSGKLAVRSRNNGTWQPWRRIAFADSDYIISADRMYYEPEHRKFTRTASGNSWDTQAYSVCGYKECRVTYKISQTGAYIMVGLNSDPTTDASYQSIDYCWYTQYGGELCIYENGNYVSSISGHTTYAVGDELIVEYSCGQVRYYHNGVLCRTVVRTYGSPLHFDCSFYQAGSIENVVFEPIHDSLDFVQTTASYSLSNASWTNTITLPTTAGSYILNIVSGNSTLTGVFSIGASDNAKDEISLHLHGNGPRLYARTNGTTLQLSSNDASATSRSVTIKYRRMI